MKKIERALPKDMQEVEIHVFADEHIGDANCNMAYLRQKVARIKETPNAFCILNGDLLDMAIRDSIGDVETRSTNVMGMVAKGVELLDDIKDRIISIVPGNHENRVYRRDGVDITQFIATQLGLASCYSSTSSMVFLSVGGGTSTNHFRPIVYTIYHLHGGGGGKKLGGKMNRLEDLTRIIDSDIFIHSHTHQSAVIKEEFIRVDKNHKKITPATQLLINTGAALDYGGYGEAQAFKPSSKDTPVIHLSGKKFSMCAVL